MGRKNVASQCVAFANKNKEKHLARKLEKRRVKDETNHVTAANKLTELTSLCEDLLTCECKGLEVNIMYIKKVKELDNNVHDWVIDLTERNMKKLYETCLWGWDKQDKVDEMSSDATRYLIAKEANGTLLAFSHFRFDMDYGAPVLYCYELQVEPESRRRGLGQRLLSILEKLAKVTNMKYVRLTVLKHNPGAVAFFRACGYNLDETSPEPDENMPHEILSKHTDHIII